MLVTAIILFGISIISVPSILRITSYNGDDEKRNQFPPFIGYSLGE